MAKRNRTKTRDQAAAGEVGPRLAALIAWGALSILRPFAVIAFVPLIKIPRS